MIEESVPGGERKLTRGDRRLLLTCLLVAVLTLAIGFYLFPKVNPEASIQFKVDRRASEVTARALLSHVGSPASDAQHASSFTYDDETKVFLERTLGVEQANALLGGELHAWRWSHRWFRPLKKEEWRVDVATTGEIAGLEHLLEEEAPGAELAQDSARVEAERFLRDELHLSLASLDFLDAKTERRPHRTDHTFIWKKHGADWAGATFRHEVSIQGDQVGSYREYVKVPDSWRRDYQKLRSKNDSAATVASAFLFLTIAAAIVMLLLRVRLGDVRWSTASRYAGIGGVLTFLAALNSLPSELFGYDTTESFAGFLTTRVLGHLLQGVAAAVLILILVGAGEALYREAYPTKLSLTRFFSLRGLRTRRFLLSAVLGLTLTCFFFAYQELFYTVAQSLGAWAPMEVPYTDLFNTAFPWIYVLLLGFLPAVTEESMSRMFSIPFLARFVRVPGVAIVLPALIWGFAHSNYPNQPFYIRGLEVSLAGILIGWLMVRVNIGTTLIWHFTVDALYTSVLLYGSKNLYYIISATLAGCVMLLPIGYAAVRYLRTGYFEEPDGMLNSDEGPAALPQPTPTPEPEIALPSRWPARARTASIAVVLASLLLLFVPSARVDDSASLMLSRAGALEQARFHLRSIGEEPDSFQVLVQGTRVIDAELARYVLQHGGVERLNELSHRYAALFRWEVRFYQPLSPREITMELEPQEGRLATLSRSLAEAESLPSLDSPQAEAVARAFLQGHGIDPSTYDLAESSVENLPKRLDHTFIWESRADDPDKIGEARHRVKVIVQGNEVGSFDAWLKLPEHWVRERETRDFLWAVRLILFVLVLGGLLGLGIWRLILGHRSGETRWGRSMRWAIPLGLIAAVSALNAWPTILARYDTSIPWSVFLVTASVGVGLRVLLTYLLCALSIAVATTEFPNAFGLSRRGYRHALLGDALLASLLVLASAAVLDHLEAAFVRLWPASALLSLSDVMDPVSTQIAWLEITTHVVRQTVFMLGMVAVAIGFIRGLRARPLLLTGGVLLAALAFVPLHAHGGAEIGAAFVAMLLNLVVGLALVRFVLRANVLAYPLGLYLALSVQAVMPFLRASGEELRSHGVIAAVLLALPVIALVAASLRGAKGSAR